MTNTLWAALFMMRFAAVAGMIFLGGCMTQGRANCEYQGARWNCSMEGAGDARDL